MLEKISVKQYKLQDYLESDLVYEYPYELEAGKIRDMPPESPENVRIAMYLMLLLAQTLGLDRVSNKAEIIISGSKVNSRVPDVTLFTEEGALEIAPEPRSTITLDMLPPLLVIEVVSPGKTNRDRDYRYKRSEYAARGIPHYWIVDPKTRSLDFFILVDGMYEEDSCSVLNDRFMYIEFLDLEIDLTKMFDQQTSQ